MFLQRRAFRFWRLVKSEAARTRHLSDNRRVLGRVGLYYNNGSDGVNFKSHFDIGDLAYSITTTWRKIYVDCPSCERGLITLKSGDPLKCPHCAGQGLLEDRSALRHVVRDSTLTIGQIRFELNKNSIKEDYMCAETGIGSGSIHGLGDLFRTRELAQAECDLRNNLPGLEHVCLRCRPEFEPISYSLACGGGREWRWCSIHENTLHVPLEDAKKTLEKYLAEKKIREEDADE